MIIIRSPHMGNYLGSKTQVPQNPLLIMKALIVLPYNLKRTRREIA